MNRTLHYSPYSPVLSPSYLEVWSVENFSLDYWRLWLGSNWKLSGWISLLYIIAIFAGQLAMKNRPPFALRKTLFLWNILLAVFSILGTLRTWPEMYYILTTQHSGLHQSVCSRSISVSTVLFAHRNFQKHCKTIFENIQKLII
jgi:hypothetical protein